MRPPRSSEDRSQTQDDATGRGKGDRPGSRQRGSRGQRALRVRPASAAAPAAAPAVAAPTPEATQTEPARVAGTPGDRAPSPRGSPLAARTAHPGVSFRVRGPSPGGRQHVTFSPGRQNDGSRSPAPGRRGYSPGPAPRRGALQPRSPGRDQRTRSDGRPAQPPGRQDGPAAGNEQCRQA